MELSGGVVQRNPQAGVGAKPKENAPKDPACAGSFVCRGRISCGGLFAKVCESI